MGDITPPAIMKIIEWILILCMTIVMGLYRNDMNMEYYMHFSFIFGHALFYMGIAAFVMMIFYLIGGLSDNLYEGTMAVCGAVYALAALITVALSMAHYNGHISCTLHLVFVLLIMIAYIIDAVLVFLQVS